MNGTYRGKHAASSQPWAVASTASGRQQGGRHQAKNLRRRRWFVLLALVVAISLAWPFLEAHLVSVDRVYLHSGDLPADIGHLHIVYLSDIHYGFGFSDSELNSLVTRINQLNPDLVLFGGDYATDNLSAARFFQRLPAIHARYAMFGVVGETDLGETPGELDHLADAMRAAKVIPLVNEVGRVRIGNSVIYVAGLDDISKGQPDLKSVAASVSSSDYVILLCHNPSIIPDAQRARDANDRLDWFDLGLFGHTHGGQIPPIASLLDIAGDVPARYMGGWLTENRVDLLISRGVGTSVIPARLFCSPQIHDIDVSVN